MIVVNRRMIPEELLELGCLQTVYTVIIYAQRVEKMSEIKGIILVVVYNFWRIFNKTTVHSCFMF